MSTSATLITAIFAGGYPLGFLGMCRPHCTSLREQSTDGWGEVGCGGLCSWPLRRYAALGDLH